jgi:peptidoglycan hydrolase-like protein with peptidoglycan-binding domain
LQQQNLYSGPIDGVWGPQTMSAVQSYQQAHSLRASGQLDNQTLASLNLPSNTPTADNSTAQPSSAAQSPDTVRQAQASLQQQGFYKGSVDGVWGPRTQGAVQSFQQSHSLSATGQLDDQTLAALNGTPNPQSSAAPAPSDATAAAPAPTNYPPNTPATTNAAPNTQTP